MASRDTLSFLAEELAVAFRPLAGAMQVTSGFRDLLEEMGWAFTTVPAELQALEAPVIDLASQLDSGQVDDSQVSALLAKLLLVFQKVSDLGSAGGLAADFRGEFPRQLVDFVIVEHMLSQQERWGFLLTALGIVRLEDVPANGPRPAFQRRIFAVEDLDDLISSPLSYLKNRYAWAQSGFDGDRLFQGLEGLLERWGLNVREQLLDLPTLAQLRAGALSPDDAHTMSLRLAFLEHTVNPDTFSAGAALYLLPETASAKPGFAVLPFATAGFEESLDIADNLSLELKGGIALGSGVAALVRPNQDIQF